MVWFEKYLKIYGKSFYELPQGILEGVRWRPVAMQGNHPLVTIVAIVHNEKSISELVFRAGKTILSFVVTCHNLCGPYSPILRTNLAAFYAPPFHI